MTIRQAQREFGTQLAGHSPSPHLDVELLLAFVLRQSRTYLWSHPETRLTAYQKQRCTELILKRKQHWPIAHLLGQTEFFGLPLHINRHVLVPRPATELLVQAALDRLPSQSTACVADIGTGSGAIALALAQQRPRLRMLAIDADPRALVVARRNARALELSSRIRWLHGSLFDQRLHQASIVIANLPYLTPRQAREPSIRREPRRALISGTDGLQHIRRLLQQLRTAPTVQTIILEFDPTQTRYVQQLLRCLWPSARLTKISDGRRTRGLVAER